MLLTIDVGNTQTVIGLYKDDALVHTWRTTTISATTADELRSRLYILFTSENISTLEINHSIVSSVVPALTDEWIACLRKLTHSTPLVCNAKTTCGIFKSHYPNPLEIGADRIADAFGAIHLYGAPVVVIDFGTATNIEIINEEGYFLGGIIAPGIETSMEALFIKASKLSAIELHVPSSAIGTSTTKAVQSGILFGEADRVGGLIKRIVGELGYKPTVVATGGLAPTLAPLCDFIDYTNDALTLEGLRIIYSLLQSEQS